MGVRVGVRDGVGVRIRVGVGVRVRSRARVRVRVSSAGGLEAPRSVAAGPAAEGHAIEGDSGPA